MIRYEIVDMFAERPFTGSALAVVPEAGDLTDGQMQDLAREFGTDETTFVLPPSRPEATHRVRVFTPAAESPYGGHSAVGTAATLVRLGVLPAGEVVQECGPRTLRIQAARDRATISAAGPLPCEEADPAPLLGAAGLAPGDLAGGVPRSAGFGPAFHLLPVRPGAVERARPDYAEMRRVGLPDLYVFTWDPDLHRVHGRLFAPGYGIPEDPACASVGLALAPWLAAEGLLPDAGAYRFHVAQGAEVGRPSRLDCTAGVTADGSLAASVSGAVVPALRGEIASPASVPAAG
ncbi:PhzF family phenazine biosynthesis protein [Spirillospora sp. CA-255316]